MATLTNPGRVAFGATIVALVAADGTGTAPWATRLSATDAATRDLADAVHTVCALHATAPGIVDLTRTSDTPTAVARALASAADAFATERAALIALTAAVGPTPSTPGQAECETTAIAQRHALAMLAQSDRAGCAIGAVGAFLLDWAAIRGVLDAAARRAGCGPVPHAMPGTTIVTQMLIDLQPDASAERAIVFGAQQLLAQHRGLWQLLDARASARRGR